MQAAHFGLRPGVLAFTWYALITRSLLKKARTKAGTDILRQQKDYNRHSRSVRRPIRYWHAWLRSRHSPVHSFWLLCRLQRVPSLVCLSGRGLVRVPCEKLWRPRLSSLGPDGATRHQLFAGNLPSLAPWSGCYPVWAEHFANVQV